jgi:chromosome segregation ATPase
MQPRLDAMNRELAEASEKLKDASAKAKADAEPRLQALREQSAALGKQLEKVKDATADTWDDVKSGFQTSFDKVKSGLNDAKNWVSDKIK